MKKTVFIFLCGLLCFSASPSVHPLHLSVTDIRYDTKTKALQVTQKIFSDDLDKAITEAYGEKLHIGSDIEDKRAGIFIEKYFRKHFMLVVNEEFPEIDVLGFESNLEKVWIYAEIPLEGPLMSCEVMNDVLFDNYDDQTNIIHLELPQGRKSMALRGGKKRGAFAF